MTSDMYERGLAIRAEVLGEDYVTAALENATDLDSDFQQLATSWCWGATWSRDGLSRRDRSLLNLAMLTALNRPAELRLHLRGALRNGCTHAEIREVLLQTAVYCGLPAAVDAFRVAREVLRDTPEPS